MKRTRKERAKCLKCNGEGMMDMPINEFGNIHPDFCPDCGGSGKSNTFIVVNNKEREND